MWPRRAMCTSEKEIRVSVGRCVCILAGLMLEATRAMIFSARMVAQWPFFEGAYAWVVCGVFAPTSRLMSRRW